MKTLFYIIFICYLSGFAQEKQIVVVDNETNKPIDLVHLFYKEHNSGSITNENGKSKISLLDSELYILHVNYYEKKLSHEELTNLDTIRLSKKVNKLDEVELSNIDLRKKLQYVLDNYNNLYTDYPTEKQCSFKESFLLNNEYKRLFLAQMRWWSANSALTFGKKYAKSVKLKLGEIRYNKNEPLGLFKTNGENNQNHTGAITTKSLVNFFYLNYAISYILKHSSEKIESSTKNSDEKSTTIAFTTNWKTNKNNTEKRTLGEIVFDKQTKAIISLKKTIEYKNRITEQTSKDKSIKTLTDYKDNSFVYSLTKNKDNKWSLTFFNATINIDYIVNSKLHTMLYSNSLYVLNETKTNKVSNKDLVDLNLPFHKNFSSETIINSNDILLTDKEQEFIAKTDNNE